MKRNVRVNGPVIAAANSVIVEFLQRIVIFVIRKMVVKRTGVTAPSSPTLEDSA